MKSLVRFFRNSLPFTFAVILFICAAFWIVEFSSFGKEGFLFDFKTQSLTFSYFTSSIGNSPLLMWVVGAAFFILFSLLVLNLNSKYIFIQERTFMPVLFLGLLVGFPNAGLSFTPVAFFSLFFVFALNRIFNSYRQDHALANYFEAAFLVGFGSFFWLPGLLFILVVFAGLAVFRQFNWREWVVTVVGFFTPVVFYDLYQLFINNTPWAFAKAVTVCFQTSIPGVTLSPFNLAFIAYVGFLVLLGSIRVLKQYDSFKIRSRKIFIVFFWMFVCSLLSFWLLGGVSYEIIFLGGAPASYLLTHFFSVDRNPSRFQAILFTLFIILAFLQVVF